MEPRQNHLMKTTPRILTLFAILALVSAPAARAQDSDSKDNKDTEEQAVVVAARARPVPLDLSSPRKTRCPSF